MLRYLENVVTLKFNAEACNGCGICTIVCPHGVFALENRRAVIADRDACIECGACVINCPLNAIQVKTGAGCAAGVLMAAIGKGNKGCSSPCGVSPDVAGSTRTGCCGSPANENKKAKVDPSSDPSSCCR